MVLTASSGEIGTQQGFRLAAAVRAVRLPVNLTFFAVVVDS